MQGVFSVLATPFRQGGDVDVESLRRYVEHFIGAGVTGFTALGVLGEAARLTERERALVLDTVLTTGQRPRPGRGRDDDRGAAHVPRVESRGAGRRAPPR